MAATDCILARIEAFNEAYGGGVVVRKQSRGYSLFQEDTGEPVARLLPTGKKDRVKIMWWSHRGKWDQIGELDSTTLDEALNYIARDPIGVFWH